MKLDLGDRALFISIEHVLNRQPVVLRPPLSTNGAYLTALAGSSHCSPWHLITIVSRYRPNATNHCFVDRP
jgi:hypothetical protein